MAVLPTADPRHARGTLVLLHGYQMSRAMFYGYDRLRRDFGWNLVLPDFRGHGESSAAQITLGIDEVADVGGDAGPVRPSSNSAGRARSTASAWAPASAC